MFTLRTRRRRDELDDRLAGGADPEASVELSLRAEQLGSRSARSRLANDLVEALGDARGPNLGAFTMRARRRDAAIRETADELLALVQRLRDEQPIEVRGVAMAARLLSDGQSPLHRDDARELEDALRAARTALDAGDPATPSLATAA